MRALGPDLMKAGEFKWLYDFNGSMRETVLYELGRIEDDEWIRGWAKRLCELKPTTKEAVAMIRRWRHGKSNSQGALALTKMLIGKINDFVHRYPDTRQQQILAALENVSDAVRGS